MKLSILFLCLVGAACHSDSELNAEWNEIAPGLLHQKKSAYRKVQVNFFKIDLRRNRLGFLQYPKGRRGSIANIAEQKKAILAVNATFFDPQSRPLGLMIENSKVLNPLRKNSWGIFQIIAGKASIILPKSYQSQQTRTFAVQAQPRLIVDGARLNFKDTKFARRTAIGITHDGYILLAVASPGLLTLQEWAEVLEMHCPEALNLDGGSSTSLWVKTNKLKLNFPGFENVPNGIGVWPK